MSFIAQKLKHRIQILQVVDTPNNIGGMDRDYLQLVRLWAGVKLINENTIIGGVPVVRGVNISELNSHEFLVRYSSIVGRLQTAQMGIGYNNGFNVGIDDTHGLSKEFDLGFDSGFDSILDIDPIKKEYFIFLEDGAGNRTRGRLFKINRVVRDEVFKKYFKIKCTQVEEQGTGFAV